MLAYGNRLSQEPGRYSTWKHQSNFLSDWHEYCYLMTYSMGFIITGWFRAHGPFLYLAFKIARDNSWVHYLDWTPTYFLWISVVIIIPQWYSDEYILMDYFTITGLFGYALKGFNIRWINPLILFQSSVCVFWDSNPSHGQKNKIYIYIYIHTYIYTHIHVYVCSIILWPKLGAQNPWLETRPQRSRD